MEREGKTISWQEMMENMNTKLGHRLFAVDVPPLLVSGGFDAHAVWATLAPKLEAAWGAA